MASIDDLLAALQNPNEGNAKLKNDFDTWNRIGNGDKFSELGLTGSDLDEFLKDWMSQNPYENI